MSHCHLCKQDTKTSGNYYCDRCYSAIRTFLINNKIPTNVPRNFKLVDVCNFCEYIKKNIERSDGKIKFDIKFKKYILCDGCYEIYKHKKFCLECVKLFGIERMDDPKYQPYDKYPLCYDHLNKCIYPECNIILNINCSIPFCTTHISKKCVVEGCNELSGVGDAIRCCDHQLICEECCTFINDGIYCKDCKNKFI